MLRMTAVHHVAVCVTDLDRAERFYGGVLGFTPIERPVFRVPGTWYELPDGSQLHLIQHAGTRTLRGTTDIDLADGHFAIRVSDFDGAVAHLRGHGVEVLELQQNPTAWKQVYFTDPDGNVIELNAER
jgi:glyoxylase I family protein